MAPKSAGCLQIIQNREYLASSKYKDKYELDYANVSTQRYYIVMTSKYKKKMTCPACTSKTPKTGNTNFAPNSRQSDSQENSPTESFVTQRKFKKTNTDNFSISLDDISNLGDTIPITNSPNPEGHLLDNPLNLRNINELLETTLQQNN